MRVDIYASPHIGSPFMSRQAPYQNPTVPPQGFQPLAFLAVRALRSVLERPDEFLAAFFSSIEGEPPCDSSSPSQLSVKPDPTQNECRMSQIRAGSVTSVVGSMLGSPLSSITSLESLVSFVPVALPDDVRTANRAGEWGCAVTPPLSLTGETLPSLLEEQAG